MRLAVLADIHAILPVLEAALLEIERDAVDGILVAGDMLAGPNPAQVLRRLRELNCYMIRGNQENYLLQFFAHQAPDWWYTSQQWSFMHWNYRQLADDDLRYLATLPEQRSIHIPDTDAIRMVHGSPRNVSELIFPDQDLSLLDLALSQVNEPVVIFGHTHRPWQMRRNGRLALNPGAPSSNFNGKAEGGSYALLNWADGCWHAELRKLTYNFDAVRNAYTESGLLTAGGAIASYWLQSIETGINYLPRFVEFAFEIARQAGQSNISYVPDQIWDKADRLFAAQIAGGSLIDS
jgi:putative phosphoesterase